MPPSVMLQPLLALTLVAVFTFAANVPLGYWRAGVRKFSPAWFVAVHAAVPLIVALRLWLDLPFSVVSLLVLVPCFFGGQWVGARLRMCHIGSAAGTPPRRASKARR